MPNEGQSGFSKFIQGIAPAIPIIGGIASNIIGGINERKARLYNSPAEQVKRLQEAGLPLAAGSQMGGGAAVSTKAASMGTENFTGHLSQSIGTQVQRKQLEIAEQELREKTYRADIAEGERNNQLNPSGQFLPTNQGTNMMNAQTSAAEAAKGAQLVNKWMPIQAAQNVLKIGKEIDKIGAEIANTLEQKNVIVAEGKIKQTLANYQDGMSMAQLEGLIARNTGIRQENILNEIAINVEYQTQYAKIMHAKFAAEAAGANLEAAHLGNILTNLSMPSTRAYYEIRRRMDDRHTQNPNMTKDIIYLGMFQPNTSNYNLNNLGGLMPNVSIRGGNTFNKHTDIWK